jgi:hypothetical protein
MKFKVAIELEGVPPHVWSEDTAAKILAQSCWIHNVEPAATSKTDLSAFKLTAWTNDPRAIPKVVWLHVAENEVHATVNAPLTLPPYLRKKDVLRYRVIVHLRHVTDFDPEDPTPPPSAPEEDNGGSGRDGNPDRHHFSRGAVPRIQRFSCNRGVVDGEPTGSVNSGPAVRWATVLNNNEPVMSSKPSGLAAGDELLEAISCNQTTAGDYTANGQPATDPMILEASLYSAAAEVPAFGATAQVHATVGQMTECAADPVSPALVTQPSAPFEDDEAPEGPAVPGDDDTGDSAVDLTARIQATDGRTTECAADPVSPALVTQPSTPLERDEAQEGPAVPGKKEADDPTTVNRDMTTLSSVEAAGKVMVDPALATCTPALALEGTCATPAGGMIVSSPAMAEPSTPPNHGSGELRGAPTAPAPEANSPPSEPTPTPSEAVRRLTKYTMDVQCRRQTPLIAEPPKQKVTQGRPFIPMRSTRIAAQQMDHIPASKRGEVLLMRKMGVLSANATPTSASRRTYDSVFRGNLSTADVEAFDELFPATKPRRTKAPRRTPLVAN